MNKTKNSIGKIGKYLREVSIVVLGVAITLSVSVWISNKNEKKNMALCLSAIITELERNAAVFEENVLRLQKSIKYANYIRMNDEKSINQDSINYYAHSSDGYGWGVIESPNIVIKDAFEMFKSFGTMRNMGNKEELVSIWEVYNRMENTQQFLDLCFQIKREESMKETQLQADGKRIAVPMKTFYNNTFSQEMVQKCEEASEMIKETILKLEKSKIIKR